MTKNNWVKEGIKREWKAMNNVGSWLMVIAVLGFVNLLSLYIPLNVTAFGLCMIVFGVFLFIKNNRRKKYG